MDTYNKVKCVLYVNETTAEPGLTALLYYSSCVPANVQEELRLFLPRGEFLLKDGPLTLQ